MKIEATSEEGADAEVQERGEGDLKVSTKTTVESSTSHKKTMKKKVVKKITSAVTKPSEQEGEAEEEEEEVAAVDAGKVSIKDAEAAEEEKVGELFDIPKALEVEFTPIFYVFRQSLSHSKKVLKEEGPSYKPPKQRLLQRLQRRQRRWPSK